jgi:hypothetical protein
MVEKIMGSRINYVRDFLVIFKWIVLELAQYKASLYETLDFAENYKTFELKA